MFLGTFRGSLLGNMLGDKSVIRAGDGVIRVVEGKFRVKQDF